MSYDDAPPQVFLRCMTTTSLSNADVERSAALLDTQELQKLQRFVAAEDRRDYAAAHALLRRLLSTIAPDTAPAAWRFERTARGKPDLPGTQAGTPPLRFSLSHTRGLVACVVSRSGDVGVDAETVVGFPGGTEPEARREQSVGASWWAGPGPPGAW